MRIAVIGGAGSGKSHVTNYLKDKYDAVLIEADKVAHNLYEPGNKGYKALIKMFGSNILTDTFNIDRKKLASILYSDHKLLEDVDNVIHPMVYEEVYKKMDNLADRLVVYEAAIMPEDPKRFDQIWYIKSDPEIRRKRLMIIRGYSSDRVDQIYKNQASDAEYEAMADEVISNDGTFPELESKIDAIMDRLLSENR